MLRATDDPMRALLSRPNELIHVRETARTWRIEAGRTPLFAKQECRELGGDRRELEWALKGLLGPSPALRTLAISLRMAECGIGVPRVVLAARRRIGLRRVEDLLVTEPAPGRALGRVFREVKPGETLDTLPELIGQRIAQLHRCGFIHGHLLRGHLYVTDDLSDVFFIDNDETRRWWPLPPPWRRRHNLAQLAQRMRHGWGYAITRRWLDSYFKASGMHGPRRRRMHRQVLRAIRERHQRRTQRRQKARPSG